LRPIHKILSKTIYEPKEVPKETSSDLICKLLLQIYNKPDTSEEIKKQIIDAAIDGLRRSALREGPKEEEELRKKYLGDKDSHNQKKSPPGTDKSQQF